MSNKNKVLLQPSVKQQKINPHNKDHNNDNWTTPKWVWECLSPHIPKDKIIWEAFYNEGLSGEILSDLGFNVIHKDIDFFTNDLGEWVVSNPPFTIKKQVLQRLRILDKPFLLLVPLDTIDRQYFRKIFKDDLDKLSLYFLPRRIDFLDKSGEYQPYRLSCIFLGYKVSKEKFIYL